MKKEFFFKNNIFNFTPHKDSGGNGEVKKEKVKKRPPTAAEIRKVLSNHLTDTEFLNDDKSSFEGCATTQQPPIFSLKGTDIVYHSEERRNKWSIYHDGKKQETVAVYRGLKFGGKRVCKIPWPEVESK